MGEWRANCTLALEKVWYLGGGGKGAGCLGKGAIVGKLWNLRKQCVFQFIYIDETSTNVLLCVTYIYVLNS